MTEELHALAGGRLMGRIIWDRKRDRLSFVYEDSWRNAPDSYPLSLSMPLTAQNHGHTPVDAFLWGLLPDNDGVLKHWGQRFQVSPRHPFQLLMHVGEECAGAVQLVRPARAEMWLAGKGTGKIQWLSIENIGDRMKMLLKDHSAVRTSTDAGQFSLAGAQPKTGFIYDPKSERWGVPSGMIPTTHIFKPATGTYDGYAENEHFCINLARSLGMPASPSEIRYFDDVPVIIVERYDRVRTGSKVLRVHQEDSCQALARKPHQKYQNQGGPSPAEILALIRAHSSDGTEDEWRFVDSLIFNWVIGGTDGHAKNYSFLIAPGSVRLAPLYDLSSSLPYPHQIAPRDAKLAMKIGNQYKLQAIGVREWKKFAEEQKIDFGRLAGRIRDLCVAMPDVAQAVGRNMRAEGIDHLVVERLVDSVVKRSGQCGTIL